MDRAGFAGPGVAYQGFGEFNQRHWLRLWADCLDREPAVAGPAEDLGAAVGGAAR